MLTKTFLASVALSAAMLPSVSTAALHSYALPDILTFTPYTDANTASTYSGNGFGGMYSAAWAHLLGIEQQDYSRTVMQVDVGGLAGANIVSAHLNFVLLDGSAGPQTATVTGFDGGAGQLTYQWDAPVANYGNVAASVAGGANAVDVTALLLASLGAGDEWFGLHLQGSTEYMWTYTDTAGTRDRAEVRLVVVTEDAAVPLPGTLALLGGGLIVMGALRRRQR